MPAVADPIGALVAVLKADADVAALVGTRVFGSDLPGDESDSMPRAAVVIKPAGGGLLDPGYQRWNDSRVDLICYAETPKLGADLYRTAHPVLKQLSRSEWAGCLLHWARPAGGPITMRDIDTDWPFTFSSWQVLASEQAV